MNTITKAGAKRKSKNYFFRWIVLLWTSVITIGVTDQLSDWEKTRTRLLNGICAMSVFILAVYCIMYSDPPHRLTFTESFVGLVLSAIPIYMNYKKKYVAACHFFCISNLLSYTFQSISHGVVDATEYILIPSSIASMLFFKNLRIVITYFLLNALFFAACKYSFTVMQPFLFMANGENLYVTNHITMFVIVFLIVFYFKNENLRQEKLLEKKNENLSEEKQKSDSLLLNILPYETAEELKSTGTAKAKSFKMVTVMFADFKNFTVLAQKISPEDLVAEINSCFSAFDIIIDNYNIEKIKTIGDSYMCAGGLPVENKTNPRDMIEAALEIQNFMQQHKIERQRDNKRFFELRIGIHTGPVVAGIVGTKKFAYDIWGDTVNTAARMQSSGEAGKINISGDVYALVKDHFSCTYRGKIEAKNKGMIDMYFVEREAASE